MSEGRQCQGCHFWVKIKGTFAEAKMGECRKRPPATGGLRSDRWPVTKSVDWCGGYVPKSIMDELQTRG